jgi:hypothetical protein
MSDRLAELESKAASLAAEIAALKAGKVTAPPPPVKPIDDRPLVTILHPLAIELPDAVQCRQLIEIVGRSHSLLQPRYSTKWHREEAFELHAGFATSVRFISTLGRTSVDTTKYLSFWTGLCRDFARLVDYSPIGNVGVSFFLAAIAMRVQYRLGDDALGILPALGLREHGGERMTADGWKQTLQGNVLSPTPPERRFASW